MLSLKNIFSKKESLVDQKAIEEFFKKVRHDLRSPVSVIAGFLNHCLGADLKGVDREFLSAALKSTDKIKKFIDELGREFQTGSAVPRSSAINPAPVVLNKWENPVTQPLGRTVLVVDDDDEIRVQWKMLLQKMDLKFVDAANGECLLKMNITYERLHAAIVDYEFENSTLTGFDVVEYLRRKNVKNIYMCTGMYQNSAVQEFARQNNVVSVIPKPIPENVAEVLGVVE